MGIEWTDERKETVKNLWFDGLSASQIASEIGLGVSRNSIIGVVHRMGLSGRTKAPSKARKANPYFIRKPVRGSITRVTNYGTRFAVVETGAPDAMPEVSTDDLQIPAEQRKSLIELENCHCRWGVGDPGTEGFFFCGDPTANLAGGKPYCAWHTKRATGHPTPRSRKRQTESSTYVPPRRRAA